MFASMGNRDGGVRVGMLRVKHCKPCASAPGKLAPCFRASCGSEALRLPGDCPSVELRLPTFGKKFAVAPRCGGGWSDYSARKAVTGSIREARRAGSQHAMSATRPRNAAMPR